MREHSQNPISTAGIDGHQTRHSILFLLLLSLGFHFVGVATPGYYSHDETQWFIRSQEIGDSLWQAWIGQYPTSQWRPISRTVWMFLSLVIYEIPILLHLANFLIVATSAVLFYFLLLRIVGQRSASLVDFVAFCAFPSTTWVVGWVATIADGMTMLVTVVIAHILVTDRNQSIQLKRLPQLEESQRNEMIAKQFLLALLFVLGLLCKEGIVILPVALAGVCLITKPWRGLLLASCSTGVIAAAFLTLRTDMILSGSESYTISASNILNNAWLYWQYPWNLQTAAIHSQSVEEIAPWIVFATVAGFTPVLYLLYRRRLRNAAAFIFYYFLFLSPALLIPKTAAHYMYDAVLPVAVVFALVFREKEYSWVKLCASGLLSVLLLHSAIVQIHIYESGRVQTRIYDVVSSIVTSHDISCGHQNTRFSIIPDRGAKSYYLNRALTEVPRIRSIPIEGRLRFFKRNQLNQGESLEGSEVVLAFNSERSIVEHRSCP